MFSGFPHSLCILADSNPHFWHLNNFGPVTKLLQHIVGNIFVEEKVWIQDEDLEIKLNNKQKKYHKYCTVPQLLTKTKQKGDHSTALWYMFYTQNFKLTHPHT